MGDRTLAALLAFLAILACARTFGAGHLCDDWVIVGHVSRHGSAGAWTGPFLDLGPESCNYYRPIFTGLFDLDYRLFGVDPFPYHVHHVLWHGLAAALLFGIMRRLGCRRPGAALAALLFACHPHLGGATGWLAARGGVVVATLGLGPLLAWLRFRSRPAPAPYALSLALAVLAVLTYEHGYLALVAPLTADLVLGGRPGWGALARRHAPFALAGAGLLAVRHHALGTLAGGYPQPSGILEGGAAAAEAWEAAGMTALRIPGAMPESITGAGPAWVVGGATALVLVAGAVTPLRRRLAPDAPGPAPGAARLLGVLLLWHFLLLALPADPTLLPGTGHRWYGAIALFAGLVGALADPLLGRRWTALLPALLLPAYVWGFLLVQDHFIAGDRYARRAIEDALAALETQPRPAGPFFVTTLPESRRSIPTLQWGFAEALRPPFQDREPPMAVYPVHRFMFLGSGVVHPFHPPVEALVYAAGGDPLILTSRDPWDADDVELGPIRFPIPRDAVSGHVRGLFAAAPLPLIHPKVPVNDFEAPFHMRVTVRADGVDGVELFVFSPTFDTRKPVPIVDGIASFDLGPKLHDYVAWREEAVDVYVLAVGYRDADPARPALSRLLTWRYRP